MRYDILGAPKHQSLYNFASMGKMKSLFRGPRTFLKTSFWNTSNLYIMQWMVIIYILNVFNFYFDFRIF